MRSSRSNPDPLDPGPAGFAHRGLHGPGIPENSLAAFQAAVAAGAGIECDVRLSGDGEVMVVHDRDLRRLCGVEIEVAGTPATQLAANRLLGTDQRIPWLGELLDLVAGRVPILIEAKVCGGNARLLAAAIARELDDYAGAVAVMSFEPKVANWFARHRPYRRRGLVVKERACALDRWTAVGYGRPHFVAAETGLLGTRWAKKIRARKFLYVWTVRSAGQRLQALVHADALIWEGDGRP